MIVSSSKFIANYGRDIRRRTRQILNPANMQVILYIRSSDGCRPTPPPPPPLQNIQNAAGISAHFPVHHTDVTESLFASYNNLPLHLPEQALTDHARRNCDITRMPLK